MTWFSYLIYEIKKKKNQSWVNITSHIGKRAWVWEAGNVYGNSNKDFPVEIGQVKKLRESIGRTRFLSDD